MECIVLNLFLIFLHILIHFEVCNYLVNLLDISISRVFIMDLMMKLDMLMWLLSRLILFQRKGRFIRCSWGNRSIDLALGIIRIFYNWVDSTLWPSKIQPGCILLSISCHLKTSNSCINSLKIKFRIKKLITQLNTIIHLLNQVMRNIYKRVIIFLCWSRCILEESWLRSYCRIQTIV